MKEKGRQLDGPLPIYFGSRRRLIGVGGDFDCGSGRYGIHSLRFCTEVSTHRRASIDKANLCSSVIGSFLLGDIPLPDTAAYFGVVKSEKAQSRCWRGELSARRCIRRAGQSQWTSTT
jgi:hypothetical protein